MPLRRQRPYTLDSYTLDYAREVSFPLTAELNQDERHFVIGQRDVTTARGARSPDNHVLATLTWAGKEASNHRQHRSAYRRLLATRKTRAVNRWDWEVGVRGVGARSLNLSQRLAVVSLIKQRTTSHASHYPQC